MMDTHAQFTGSRRRFLTAAAVTAGACLTRSRVVAEEDAKPEGSGPWLKKTLKAGMIGVEGSWEKKFQAALDAGFLGVEPNTGELDVAALRAAAEKTGLIIDGTVAGYHWAITHTNPDPQVRAKAQQLLEQSLQQTAALGAKTMLLVPGHGNDGTADEVRSRAFDAISNAIPLADKLGVHIVVENVWNHFLYDHSGDENQSAQPLADFIASFGTDTVGVQFDLGNHWKYGDVAQWTKTLGPHIQKLDIKGFSRASDGFTDITEGDIDWESVRKALVGIGFQGWLAAEVGGGDEQRLAKVAGQMEKALHCNKTFADVSAETKQPA